jgi:ClpX C4-type zinc finger
VRERVLSVLAQASLVKRGSLHCSFCGRDHTQVERLVAGGSAHICDGCIAECVAVLDKHGGFDRPGPTQTH